MDAFVDVARRKEEEEYERGKEVVEEDVVPGPDPVLNEDPFLKDIKVLGGKYLEGVPLFSGNMDIDAFMDWLDGTENPFECEGVSEAQKVNMDKSRLRGSTLSW